MKTHSLIKGFLVGDYKERFEEGIYELNKWVSEGYIKNEVTITEGFENILKAFLDLFEGKNFGKQFVKISEI